MPFTDSIDHARRSLAVIDNGLGSPANLKSFNHDTQFCKIGTVRPSIEMAPENK